jgi:tRNA threonylcarbamoyl adenosine modification protein YeaZ
MKVLAIELSTAAGSVAVVADGEATEVRRFACPRGRGAEVFDVLAGMRWRWQGITRVAAGIGPGSYNGLRAACALAGAIQSSLGIDAVLAPSVCLLDVEEQSYFATGDARGGRFFWAEVRDRTLAGDIRLVDKEELALLLVENSPVYRVGPMAGRENIPSASPDAGILALLAPSLTAVKDGQLEPIYLKPPHITMPKVVRP